MITTPTNLTFIVNHIGHIAITPETLQLKRNPQDDEYTVNILGIKRGHFEISAIASPANAIEYEHCVFHFC